MNTQALERAAAWAGRLLFLAAVGVGLLLAASAGARIGAAQSSDSPGCWSAVQVAPTSASLSSIAVVSPADIWAVGVSLPAGRAPQTLTEHWNGTQWSVVPSPSPGAFGNGLSSVAAFASDDVWAVGSYGNAGTDSRTLALHWDGHAWAVVPTPSPSGRINGLTSVAGTSSHDLWAVGAHSPSVIDTLTLILHWDGTQWSVVPSPSPGKVDNPVSTIYGHALSSVVALSPDDAWAVGSYAAGSPGKPAALALHWDGHAWTAVPTGEAGHINALSALGPTEIWAVGYQENSPLVMRWDGAAWSKIALPGEVLPRAEAVQLQGIAARAAGDIWVSGGYETVEGASAALILHRDGQGWSLISTDFAQRVGYSDSRLSSVVTINGDLWAAGSLYNRAGGPTTPLLVRHTAAPCSAQTPVPTPVDPFKPPYPVPGSGARTFPETGRTVSGIFLDYWNAHGGLMQQGFPISNPLAEQSEVNGQAYTMQYFERAVFEYHPENQPPNNVLLSLLGVFEYRQKYPQGAPGQQANTSPGSVFFAQTGHRLGGVFLGYWRTHGGLAQQGYPISDEFTEVSPLDGKAYTVQYFERAVFEHHPEGAGTAYEVLLSQLGTFRYRAKYGPRAPLPIPTEGPSALARVRIP